MNRFILLSDRVSPAVIWRTNSFLVTRRRVRAALIVVLANACAIGAMAVPAFATRANQPQTDFPIDDDEIQQLISEWDVGQFQRTQKARKALASGTLEEIRVFK